MRPCSGAGELVFMQDFVLDEDLFSLNKSDDYKNIWAGTTHRPRLRIPLHACMQCLCRALLF